MVMSNGLLLLCALHAVQSDVHPGSEMWRDADRPSEAEVVHVTWFVPADNARRLRTGRSQAPEHLHVSFAAAGAHFELRLARNRALLPRSFRHVLHHADGSTEEGPTPPSCFYIGNVLGDGGGTASISACDGSLSGLVIAHDRVVTLEPKQSVEPAVEDTFTSRFRNEPHSEDDWVEPLLAEMSDNMGRKEHVVRRMLNRSFLDRQAAIARFVRGGLDETSTSGVNISFRRRLEQSSVKYVEVALSNDNSRYSQFNGQTADLAKQSADVMNSVTAMYREPPTDNAQFPFTIQIVLVAQHTFLDQDPWKDTVKFEGQETDSSSLLGLWNEWAFTQTQSGGMSQHDNHVLLSGRDFDGPTVGLAGVSSMCNLPRSGNVNMCGKDSTVAFCAAVTAHEIGHNFGMRHDSSGNSCPQSGLIMNAVLSSPPTQFSHCSVTYIKTFFEDSYAGNGKCLENAPTLVYGDPVCKNGFVEQGEDCDCGGADCSGKDDCCNGETCKFAQASYQCSAAAGPCCENCMIVAKSKAKECRESRGTCDIAETCPGTSAECPRDEFVYPGKDCTISGFAGKCFAGACNSMSYTCSVAITRDFEGSWDLTEPCAVSNDLCQNVVCHDKSGEDEYQCGQSFATHGKQMSVPDGTPCWFPSMPAGTRSGMCSAGACQLPHALAEVPLCGNGGIDFGEQCDCGADPDPCCECSTCQLKADKQCSSHEPCCTSSCAFKASGEVCRAATDECDVAEVCAGSTGECPTDVGKKWGTECKDSTDKDSTCYGKKCLDGISEQCRKAYPSHPNGYNDLTQSKCTALMCCDSSSCSATTKSKTFTVNGVETKIYIGGAFDGTVLSDKNKMCRRWEDVTPDSSCAQGSFLDESVGQCVACSSACQACNGPTSFDCVGECKYNVKDSRAVCALSAEQATLLSKLSTTSLSPTSSPVVKVSFVVNNVIYSQLVASDTLKKSFVDAVKAQIANAVAGINPEHVEVTLSSGSVQVEAEITPPAGVSVDSVSSAINSADSLTTAVAAAISQIPGIDSVSSGNIGVQNATVVVETDTTTPTSAKPMSAVVNAVVRRCGVSFTPLLILVGAASW